MFGHAKMHCIGYVAHAAIARLWCNELPVAAANMRRRARKRTAGGKSQKYQCCPRALLRSNDADTLSVLRGSCCCDFEPVAAIPAPHPPP